MVYFAQQSNIYPSPKPSPQFKENNSRVPFSHVLGKLLQVVQEQDFTAPSISFEVLEQQSNDFPWSHFSNSTGLLSSGQVTEAEHTVNPHGFSAPCWKIINEFSG